MARIQVVPRTFVRPGPKRPGAFLFGGRRERVVRDTDPCRDAGHRRGHFFPDKAGKIPPAPGLAHLPPGAGGAVIAGGALCLLVSLDVLALAPVVMGILLLLLGAGLPRMAVRMADNMLKKDLKSCHPVCITFDGDGMRKTVHGIVTTVPYESFSHLLLCRGIYVVGLEGETTRYQSLPKDCFTQGDPEAFPDFFREKTGLSLVSI